MEEFAARLAALEHGVRERETREREKRERERERKRERERERDAHIQHLSNALSQQQTVLQAQQAQSSETSFSQPDLHRGMLAWAKSLMERMRSGGVGGLSCSRS